MIVFLLSRISPFVDLHRDDHAHDGRDEGQADPDDHHGELGVREEVEAELDVEDQLGQSDADKHPSLTSQSLATFVGHVSVVLPEEKKEQN